MTGRGWLDSANSTRTSNPALRIDDGAGLVRLGSRLHPGLDLLRIDDGAGLVRLKGVIDHVGGLLRIDDGAGLVRLTAGGG